MTKEIVLKLITQEDESGQKQVHTECETDDLEALSLALISTESLREVTLLSSGYIIASSSNPTAVAEGLVEFTNQVLKEGGLAPVCL